MAMIQIRDVPEADRRALKARASAAGQSLNTYVREVLHREATTPTADEVLARAAARSGRASVSALDSVVAGRRER